MNINDSAGMNDQSGDASLNFGGSFKPTVQFHQYGTGPRVYCACCGKEVTAKDDAFKCSLCGSEPVHDHCRDPEFSWCLKCGKTYQVEEQQRELCGRLALLLKGLEGQRTVFLFAKRTLQFGRSREDQLPAMRHRHANVAYSPGANDVVVRVMHRHGNDLKADPEASKMVSRVHGAFHVSQEHGREVVQAIDCGMNGSGSSSGVWVNLRKQQPAKWYSLGDLATVTLGRDPAAHLDGLALTVRVYRNMTDTSKIDTVVFSRNDALQSMHSYVMVVREAAVGLGAVPISLVQEQEDQASWGSIKVDGARLVYSRRPDTPLKVDNTASAGDSANLTRGVTLKGGAFGIEVSEVSDKDFYSVNG